MAHTEAADYRPAPSSSVDRIRQVFIKRNEAEMRAGEWVYARKRSDGQPGMELFKPRSSADLR